MREYWEESEIKNKTINAKKIIISIIMAILIVAIIVMVALYITNNEFRNWIDVEIFRKEISQEGVATIELDEGESSNIYAFNKYIGILSKNQLHLYGATGTEETNLEIQINNPLFDSANRFLVIGESNGQKVYAIEDKEVIWESEIEGNISQVYVNKNGYVAVIISGTSHKSVIQVFDPTGTALFKKYLPSTVAVDVTISNDNKYLAIAEIDTSGTVIQSNIRIISIEMTKTDPRNSEVNNYKSEQNKLLVNIAYQDKDRIVCMYTDTINVIENGQESVIFDNNNKKITAQSIDLKNYFTTIQEESSGIFSADSVINIVNVDSKETQNYIVETSVKEMYTRGDIIALNLGTEVEFINTAGWLVKRYRANQEVSNVTASDNIAGIIYRDKVEIINL